MFQPRRAAGLRCRYLSHPEIQRVVIDFASSIGSKGSWPSAFGPRRARCGAGSTERSTTSSCVLCPLIAHTLSKIKYYRLSPRFCYRPPCSSPFLSEKALVLEIGAGNCALAAYLAPFIGTMIALEVCEEALSQVTLPQNLSLVLSDALCLALPAESVDLAYSCHVLEHLHPEDVDEHLREVRRVLKPGGAYVCVTPNRLLGPHDVSKYFGDEPSGLHLQEYAYGDLARLFRESGYTKLKVLRGLGRPPTPWPTWPYTLFEYPLSLSPVSVRRRALKLLGGQPPFRPLEQVKLVAEKPHAAASAR